MHPAKHARRARRLADFALLPLESRRLLSATLTSQIPNQVLSATSANTVTLSTYFRDNSIATGDTVVNIKTSSGDIPIELTNAATPQNVANFLHYISSGEFANTIFHRSVPGFVIQGGGYTTDGTQVTSLGAVAGESTTATLKNTTGTIATALSNGPDSGTSDFFINLADNTQLDDTSDGGPFTAFGKVIYNGMTVVNSIAGLGLVDASAENGAWSTLPVNSNYTGSTGTTAPLPVATTPVPAADLVVTNPVVVTGALTYSVQSSNPAIVSASIINGNLVLTPVSSAGGNAFVTVTATDLGGGTAISQIPVSYSATSVEGTLDVVVGSGAGNSVSSIDANGTHTTITLRGPGTATVTYRGINLAQAGNSALSVTGAASIDSIVTANTTSASVLTVSTTRNRTTSVGGIFTDSLRSIVAPNVNLTGDLGANASIGSVSLASAQNGSVTATSIGSMTIGGTFSDDVTLNGGGTVLNTFKAGGIGGGTWNITGSINTITANAATDWALNVSGTVKTIQINRGGGITGGSVTAASIGSVAVTGYLYNADLELTEDSGVDLKTLKVGGAVTGSFINAAGSIGKVTAASLINSQIYAGVGNVADGQTFITTLGQFVTPQTIGSVSLKTVRSANSFSNSDIAAHAIGNLALGSINSVNGGVENGVTADTISSLSGVTNKRFVLTRLTPADDGTTRLTSLGVVLGDFEINLV